jgi:hypothetical protein
MSETLAALEAAFLMAQASPVVVEPDVVTIPYGEIISAAASYIATALIAVSMWALRFVPGQIRAMLMTMRVDQLLGKAIAFGVNATAGAVKDKVLTIEVSNRVLREALSYALLHGGPLVKRIAGRYRRKALGSPRSRAGSLQAEFRGRRLCRDARSRKVRHGARGKGANGRLMPLTVNHHIFPDPDTKRRLERIEEALETILERMSRMAVAIDAQSNALAEAVAANTPAG